jgi:hypothetical protein
MPDIFVAEPKNKDTTVPEMPYVLEKQERSDKPMPVISPIITSDHAVHLFSSFCKNPDGISFENQEKDEKILLFLRKDFITNAKWILLGIMLILLPLLFIFSQHLFGTLLPFLSIKFYLILLLFYYLFVITFFYINFITWYYNVALITDQRIIDVDFSSLVYKDVATTKLSLVQDVSYAQVGVVRTFFDYGNILIQTAGSLDNFIFECSPQPEDAVHVVEELIGKRNE